MADVHKFRDQVKLYRKQQVNPQTGKRYTQQELAHAIALSPHELSHRLNDKGRSRLKPENILAIVKVLARWATVTPEQAIELLILMDYPLISSIWKTDLQPLLGPLPDVALSPATKKIPPGVAPHTSEGLQPHPSVHPHSPTNKPSIPFVVPHWPNPSFQERPSEFATISRLFFEKSPPASQPSGSPCIIGFVGMGGSGKTELAVQLAYHYQKEERFPAGIFWLSMSGSTPSMGITLADLQRLFAQLWEQSRLPAPDGDEIKPDNERNHAYQMCRYLARHPDALLILDNLDHLIENTAQIDYVDYFERIDTLFSRWLPNIAGERLRCSILYTSRYHDAPGYITPYPVEGLSKEGAWHLLLEHRPTLLKHILADNHSQEAEIACAICNDVGYLPLPLTLLREFLRDPHLTLAHLREEQCRRGTIDLTTRFGQDVMTAKLFRTFEQSWNRVSLPHARQFFKLAVYFPEAIPIPLWLIGLAAGLSGQTSVDNLGEARDELQRWGLITLSPDQYFLVHPLLREFGQILIQYDPKRFSWQEEASNRLVDAFTSIDWLKERARTKGYVKCLADVQIALNYAHLFATEQAIALLEQAASQMTSVLEKLQQRSAPLQDYAGHVPIRRGIVTGFNEAFVIDKDVRSKLISEDAQSRDLIKPLLSGQDIRRYAIDSQERYLIWTYSGVPLDQYPAISKYLQQYQTQLEKRSRAGNVWWELPPYPYYADFEKPKIIFPSIAKAKNRFVLEREQYYLHQHTFFLPIDDFYLISILNSHLLSLFFRLRLPSLFAEDFLEYRPYILAETPIRRIHFITSAKDREVHREKAERLYHQYLEANTDAALLHYVHHHLSQEPEASDIVHDLLAYLAQEMTRLNKEKQTFQNQFLHYLSDTLYIRAKEGKAGLETLAGHSRLHNYPGEDQEPFLSFEELWDIILKNRHRLDLPPSATLKDTIQIHYEYNQGHIEPIKQQIRQTDALIDQIVYRLYGLTEEERALLEEDKQYLMQNR